MTNREKINELGGVLLEPEGSGSDKYFLMVSEKWLDSEYKEPDHIADTSEMVEPTKNDLGVDCISRKAALDITWHDPSYSDPLNVLTEVRDKIRELPSVTTRTRWIPVSERLPEIHNYRDNYLVTLKRGGVYIATFTECDGKHWWTYDDVVAWMPLPQPYREVEE